MVGTLLLLGNDSKPHNCLASATNLYVRDSGSHTLELPGIVSTFATSSQLCTVFSMVRGSYTSICKHSIDQ